MGLLDWLRPTAPAPSPAPATHALAMVLLESTAVVDAAAILAQLRTHAPDLPLTDVETSDTGVTTAKIPGGAVGIIRLPMPVPHGDLAGPVALAWHWPEAEETVARHGAHVIVHAASDTLDPLALRLLHTRLVAAVAATTDALGVYIGEALLVRAAADYVEDAREASAENPPLLSWVGFNLVGEPDDRFSAYTTGLERLGMPELEVRRVAQPAPAVIGLLADVAHYQLTTGKRLKDGDTFGASADDRRRVRHARSSFIPKTPVMLLEA
jgi:hypothetical protein